MPKVKVNDIDIFYKIYEEGFPLIMITGLAGDLNWWSPKEIKLCSHYFKTVIFDNRGAGRTSKP